MASADAILRPVREGDAEALAAVMRPADVAECMAAEGLSPLDALLSSISSSACFTGELGGEVAAIFGVRKGPRRALLGATAFDVVWLLTGRAVDRHPRGFLRASRRALGAFLDVHPVLENMIDARYEAAVRWARHLGAEIQPAIPWGASGMPFHLAVWRASSWA